MRLREAVIRLQDSRNVRVHLVGAVGEDLRSGQEIDLTKQNLESVTKYGGL